MKLHAYRTGFACNSSSSHSIVVLKPGKSTTDYMLEGQSFGWTNFVAASQDAKRDYLGQILANQIARRAPGLDDDALRAVLSTYLPGWSWDKDGYVDHQSVFSLPGETLPDRAFFRELAAHVLSDSVVVLGGNDNDDMHPSASIGDEPAWYSALGDGIWKCRKDGDYWTLFCKSNGNRVRISFDDCEAPTRSTLPELVDVKITERCNEGCSFCYQASAPTGKDASSQDLIDIAYALGKLGVFEVAIGGGDALLHPQLEGFLERLNWNGIAANMTVRNLGWIKGSRILHLVSGLAVSVHNAKEATAAMKAWRAYRRANPEEKLPALSLQHVVGLVPPAELSKILKTPAPITLLGWKACGRAGAWPPHPYSDEDFVRVLKGHRRIGMDAALVDRFRAVLLAMADERTFSDATEGAFSCYIDAIRMTMHRSSYSEESVQLSSRSLEPQIRAGYLRLQADG